MSDDDDDEVPDEFVDSLEDFMSHLSFHTTDNEGMNPQTEYSVEMGSDFSLSESRLHSMQYFNMVALEIYNRMGLMQNVSQIFISPLQARQLAAKLMDAADSADNSDPPPELVSLSEEDDDDDDD